MIAIGSVVMTDPARTSTYSSHRNLRLLFLVEFFGVLPAGMLAIFALSAVSHEPAASPEMISVALLKVAPCYTIERFQ